MTSPEPLRSLTWRELAEQQDSVLARTQALALGLGEEGWNWRLTTERWRPVIPGVAITHSGEPTPSQLAWAAVLHAGRGAALSGDAGLVRLGFRFNELNVLDVAVPWPREVRGGRLLGGSYLRPHTVRHLGLWVHPVREPSVVRVEPALLHAVAWAGTDKAAEWRVAAAVQQRLVQVADVRTALTAMPKLPRRSLLLTVLDDVELGAHAGSELQFLRFCREHGLPLPDELQVRVRAGGTKYVDARYRRQRVSVELDGAHHMRVEQWDADTLRGLHLAVAHHGTGETLVRLTMGNLRHEGSEVAGLLGQLLL